MRYLFPVLIFLWISFSMQSQDCEQAGRTPAEVLAHRKDLLSLMDSTSALVMKAADADDDIDIDPYRQNPDFLYLTGIDQPGYKVIFCPSGYPLGSKSKKVLIFTYPYQMNLPVILSETDTLLNDKIFEPVLSGIVKNLKTLYYSPVPKLYNDWVNGKVVITEREMKKTFEQGHQGVKLKPAQKLFASLRQVKTAQEIVLLSKAIAITREGILSVMSRCKPGMYEYELQAIIEYEAKRRGAESMAFTSIIGSGANSLIPHYDKNSCRMNKGDIAVMDIGARYGAYCADISRTIPVSGKFSDDQKIIYQAVLDIQKAVIDMVKPGVTMSDLDAMTGQLTRKAGYGHYILHGVTHPLGIVVHDVSRGDTLRPGMVITVEPGIYIPVNDTVQPVMRRGFGVRIEDDILVTADGHEVLSREIPKEVAEIEKLMKKRSQKQP